MGDDDVGAVVRGADVVRHCLRHGAAAERDDGCVKRGHGMCLDDCGAGVARSGRRHG